MRILILEDSVQRIDAFRKHLTNHQLFITDDVIVAHEELRASYADGQPYDIAMLDNDLGDLPEGRKLADMIKHDSAHSYAYVGKLRKIIIHSSNIVAASYMKEVLFDAINGDVEQISFPYLSLSGLNEVQ